MNALQTAMARRGSPRTLALMRISLALLLFSRWARELQMFRDMQPDRIDMPSVQFWALSTIFYASTTSMLFGAWSRLSTAVAGLSALTLVVYVGEVLGHEPYTHHHTWALALGVALLALTPCGGSWSWDRWRVVQRAEAAGETPPPEEGPLWALPLIAVHVCAIYIWGTYAKLSPAYMNSARMDHYMMFLYFGSDIPDGGLFRAFQLAQSWVGILIEPVLAVGLWFRRSRRWLFPIGLAFHGYIYWTLPVGTFSMTMWALYIAFLDPDAVHRAIDRMAGREVAGRAA
jgi:hypothetical protein